MSWIQYLIIKALLDEKLNQKQDKLYCSALLLNEWIELKDLMWTKNCIISPGKFVKNIQTIAGEKGSWIYLLDGHKMTHQSFYCLYLNHSMKR